MPVPTFRAAASGTAVAGNSVSVTIPASTVVGDLLLFTISGIGGSPITPTGWQAIETTATSGSGPYSTLWSYWKIAAVGDAGSSVTVSISGGTSVLAAAVTVWQDGTGVATSNDMSESTSSSTIVAPAVSSSGSALRTITVWGSNHLNTSLDITPSNTERIEVDAYNGGLAQNWVTLSVSDDTNPLSTTRTATLSTPRDRRTAHTIVIAGNAPPTLTNPSPADGAFVDLRKAVVFDAAYADPEGNPIGDVALRRQRLDGAIQWWNGSAWQGTEVLVPNSSLPLTVPAGAFTEQSYRWSMAVTDSAGAQSAYTPWRSIHHTSQYVRLSGAWVGVPGGG